MRTEKEMFGLILGIANRDERIRGVYMNGSRTNSNANKDIFQDYDIVYVVEETLSFREDRKWIENFGKVMYMQYPDENSYYDSDVENCYGWLVQFEDGNRLDLHVCTLGYSIEDIKSDKLCKILLDKDNALPKIPEATDEDYWVKIPSEANFLDTANEFWWCLNNVAKGLWREEVPYVMDMINYCIRPQLMRLLSWKIGLKTDFKVSIGKSGKYMYKWLSKEEWGAYLKTFSSPQISDIYESVYIMCDLFNNISNEVASAMNFKYNQDEADNSIRFLIHTQKLPKDAKEIY